MRIAHVSDIHVGAHDDLALDGLAGDLRQAEVSATVVTGDLTMRARRRQFARARAVIDGFPPPTLVVIGNHDVPLLNPLQRLWSPYDRYREAMELPLDPVLDLPGVRIQGLASMPWWRWKSGRVSRRQSDLVRVAFQDCSPGTVRVIAMHHPPSQTALAGLVGGQEFRRAMLAAEVDVVLAGHTHIPTVRVLPGTSSRPIVEVVAGTATSHRTRGAARSWTLLEIGDSQVSATAHTAVKTSTGGSAWAAAAPEVFPLYR